jgi:hypothetical protein
MRSFSIQKAHMAFHNFKQWCECMIQKW